MEQTWLYLNDVGKELHRWRGFKTWEEITEKMKFLGLRESIRSSTCERISQDTSSIMTGGRERLVQTEHGVDLVVGSRVNWSPDGSFSPSSVQFSCSVVSNSLQPHNNSTPGLPDHHQLPEFTQTHVHRDGDAIQPSHPLSSPSPPAPNPSQHQGLFQWVNSSHQVAKVLEFQLEHQSFQWTPRTDLL